MRIIKLTNEDGSNIYINANKIIWMHDVMCNDDTRHTEILAVEENSFHVKETPDQITTLIEDNNKSSQDFEQIKSTPIYIREIKNV